MKLRRDIDGVDLAKHLIKKWSYRLVQQTGSHMKLRTDAPTGHTATIPAHRAIKVGTLSGIVADICAHKGVSREDLLREL